jgi:signal transduction histidine kinase
MNSLAQQRRVLAAKLITIQEEVLRSVSRELHDEFGQILTAVGAMLSRAERKGVPPDSPLRTELSEVRQITQQTLEKMRSLSQMLHPAILDDYGLAKGVEWYAGVFQRQTGIKTDVTITGNVIEVTGASATHCFRILQEALTNVAKHSGSDSAEVQLNFGEQDLTLTVQDRGSGLPATRKKQRPGLGLIAMHERAELVHGDLTIKSRPSGGTIVTLRVPLHQERTPLDEMEGAEVNEVIFRES